MVLPGNFYGIIVGYDKEENEDFLKLVNQIVIAILVQAIRWQRVDWSFNVVFHCEVVATAFYSVGRLTCSNFVKLVEYSYVRVW